MSKPSLTPAQFVQACGSIAKSAGLSPEVVAARLSENVAIEGPGPDLSKFDHLAYCRALAEATVDVGCSVSQAASFVDAKDFFRG